MKKYTAVIFILLILFSISGCGGLKELESSKVLSSESSKIKIKEKGVFDFTSAEFMNKFNSGLTDSDLTIGSWDKQNYNGAVYEQYDYGNGVTIVVISEESTENADAIFSAYDGSQAGGMDLWGNIVRQILFTTNDTLTDEQANQILEELEFAEANTWEDGYSTQAKNGKLYYSIELEDGVFTFIVMPIPEEVS